MSIFTQVNNNKLGYTDGDFSIPKQTSPWIPEISDDGTVSYTASFVVDHRFFREGLKNSNLENTFPAAYLVKESTPVHIGGGLLEYTREFSEIPTARGSNLIDYTTFVYEFPAYIATLFLPGRATQIRTVPAQIHNKYYLTDNPFKDIPIIQEQTYLVGTVPAAGKALGDISTPTRTLYEGWVTDKVLIVPQASSVQRYKGNMYKRSTLYIEAQ